MSADNSASASASALTTRGSAALVLVDQIDSVRDALAFKTFTDPVDGPPSREAILLEYLNAEDMRVDPESLSQNLPTLMKRAGLLLPEMLDLIRKKDIAIAMTMSGRHVGEIMEGLGEFSKPKWVDCKTCDGEGVLEDKENPIDSPDLGEPTIAGTKACTNPECKLGKVRQMGNLDAAKLFLEAQGLKHKGGAQTINVGTQVGVRVDAGGTSKSQQESVTSRVQSALEGG